jgi:hypothetical protein
MKQCFKKINWEATSVIIAMMLFITNILWAGYQDRRNEAKDKIRTMFAYEISYNHNTLRFLDSTRQIGFNKNAETMTGEPFAINLNYLGGVRLDIASNQTDDVYKDYFDKLSKLDKDEVTLIMDYYHEQHQFLNEINVARKILLHTKDKDQLDIEGFTLERTF